MQYRRRPEVRDPVKSFGGFQTGGPAVAAGIEGGDLVVEVDQHAVQTADQFNRDLARHAAGTPTVPLQPHKGGRIYVAMAGPGVAG